MKVGTKREKTPKIHDYFRWGILNLTFPICYQLGVPVNLITNTEAVIPVQVTGMGHSRHRLNQ
jgi:hypothetical protein